MDIFFPRLSEFQMYRDILGSVLFVIIILVLQHFTLAYLNRRTWTNEIIRLKVYGYCKQAFLSIIVIGLIVTWIPEIQSFALSIAAIAVAIAVSLKELLMCLTGSLSRASADLFSIGDRIHISGIVGDVMRIGFLYTDVIEVKGGNQRSGNVIRIPNSMFLLQPVLTEVIVNEHILSTLVFPIPFEFFRPDLKNELLNIAVKYGEEVHKQVQTKFKKFAQQRGFSEVSTQPRVIVQPVDYKEIKLILRFVAKEQDRVTIEQQITDEFMAYVFKPHSV